jgi:hypothetical protein
MTPQGIVTVLLFAVVGWVTALEIMLGFADAFMGRDGRDDG